MKNIIKNTTLSVFLTTTYVIAQSSDEINNRFSTSSSTLSLCSNEIEVSESTVERKKFLFDEFDQDEIYKRTRISVESAKKLAIADAMNNRDLALTIASFLSPKDQLYSFAQLYTQSHNVALLLVKSTAEGGVAGALFWRGNYFEKGRFGYERDLSLAISLYRMAAEKGDARAQSRMGEAYVKGTVVSKNKVEAVRMYQLATDQGNANGQVQLGLCYANGRGVGQDDVAAALLYSLAADQGNANGQVQLGLCYANGRGVGQDDVAAALLYSLAADQRKDPTMLPVTFIKG